MKPLRFWLVVLLTLLLALRGAFAAPLLCDPISSHETHHESGHVVIDADQHQHESHETQSAALEKATAKGAAHSNAHNACNMCSSLCSSMPLLSQAAALLAPTVFVIAAFPLFDAPAPWFISSGPERPPRNL